MLLSQVRPRHLGIFPMKIFHRFPIVFQPLGLFPGVSIHQASCPFDKIWEFLELLVYPSDLSCVGDYLTFNDSLHLAFEVSFDVLWFSWGLFSVGSGRDFIGFQ